MSVCVNDRSQMLKMEPIKRKLVGRIKYHSASLSCVDSNVVETRVLRVR